jgi:uncharacterized protein (DUF1330 family)
MAAYLIVEHTITDPAKFEEYRVKVGPLIAKHGGKYITKGGSHRLLETDRRPPDRVVIIEFPNMSALNAWYSSAEYQPLIALRHAAVDMNKETLCALDGV